MKNYIDTIEHRIAGIPCLIGIIDYQRVEGSYSQKDDSDLDYYGYTDCDYEVLDRRGRPAPWLEKKLTDKEAALIDERIEETYCCN